MAVTDIDTGFPDTELPPQATITIDTGDASAKVTLLNVYGISPVHGAPGSGNGAPGSGNGEPVEVKVVAPLFAYGKS